MIMDIVDDSPDLAVVVFMYAMDMSLIRLSGADTIYHTGIS